MDQSKRITDAGLLLAVFIILMLIAIFVPVTMIIIMFLLPVPFVYYASKYDWRSSLLMIGVAIILSLFFATVISLPITVFAGFGGIMIGLAINNRSPYETWARGTLGFIGGLLFTYLFTQHFLNINWATEIEIALNDSFQMSREIVEQFGFNLSDEQFSVIYEQLLLIKDLIPVAMVLIAMLFAFLAQWFSYKTINRLQNKQMKFPPFRNFKLPMALIWIYLIALLFTVFDLNTDDILFVASYNVLVLVGFLLTIQGFSFIFFYANFKNWSIAIPIIFLVFSLLIPYILLYLVRIIGIIDIGFRLRDRLLNKGS